MSSSTATLETLKILIVSTPKTGNTWLRNLLAAAYGLPMVELNPIFDAAEAEGHGARWIAHQHFYPEAGLLSWAEQHGVVLLTTVRHPGDVLISLYHYVHNFIDRANGFGTEAAMAADDQPFGDKTAGFVKGTFHGLLDISIQWMDTGRSQVVRYEDLWRDPVGTLAALTDRIYPLDLDTIERAVEQCDISVMRKMAGRDGKFFRKGGSGNWRQDLPPEIVALFGAADPYPAQLARLGYTFADEDPEIVPRTARRAARVSAIERFANGVPVPPIATVLYLSFSAAVTDQRWPDFADTSAGSFYAWMCARAEADPQSRGSLPIVTNLAAYIHRQRPDLQAHFPDLYGQSRVDYVLWFSRAAGQVYQLDEVFLEPARLSFRLWANAPSDQDARPRSAPTLITNVAAHVYRQRPDLQVAYPDVYGADRVAYVQWFIRHGIPAYELESSYALPIAASWTSGWVHPQRYASLWQLYTALVAMLLGRFARAAKGSTTLVFASALLLASQSGIGL